MAVPLPRGDLWFRELLTPRLRITPLTGTHRDQLVAYRNDPDVAAMQDWEMPFTNDLADELITEMATLAPLVPGRWFQFAFVDRSDGHLAGDAGLYRDADDPGHLKIGYTLARNDWAKGLATEAVEAILDYAPAAAGATSITAEALAANEPSVRLLSRLGFIEVDRNVRVEQVNGVWHDEVIYRRDADPPADAVGAVLIGGASTRMGDPKPVVEIGGAPMFEHVTAALESAGLDVVVVGSGLAPEHPYPTISDPPGVAGPVAGIAAALDYADGRAVFVVATDQPYLSPSTVRRLLAIRGDLVAPVDHDRVQVTCAVYRRGFADRLSAILASDPTPSIQEPARRDAVLVHPEIWRSWGEDGRSWRSLDTPASLTAATRDLGEPVR